jgi:DNA polymerase
MDEVAGFPCRSDRDRPSRMAAPLSRSDALDLLRWYGEIGVDACLADEPADHLAAPARRPEPLPAGHAPAAPRPVPPAPALLTGDADAVVLAARDAAAAAGTLDELRLAMERFEGCALKATASRLVFADGAADARIMLVGEAPGREEDQRGRPFVGRSGQLLDRMLGAIGLDRSTVYIANIVPWRPPGNRTPTPQETATCKPFIERQIALVAPEVLVCLGAPSTQALLGVKEGIMKLRGRWLHYDLGDRTIPAMATLHPAFLLRQPAQKRLAWRDFRAIRTLLETRRP